MRLLQVFSTALLLVVFGGTALSDTQWTALTDPEKIRDLVTGRTLDGKYWLHFYRADGNMSYYHVGTDAMSVRKWVIKEDGNLCVAVFSRPDRVIDCFTILRAVDDATQYQLQWASGLNAFELLDEPPKDMADAINKVAGEIN